MRTVRAIDHCPHRFTTLEDAQAFLDSRGSRFDLIVPPFVLVDGRSKQNDLWKAAPYELALLAQVEDGQPTPINFQETDLKLERAV